MSIIVALFMGLTVSAEEIIKDRKVLKREEFLNLSRLSYLFSKVFILFSLSAIASRHRGLSSRLPLFLSFKQFSIECHLYRKGIETHRGTAVTRYRLLGEQFERANTIEEGL